MSSQAKAVGERLDGHATSSAGDPQVVDSEQSIIPDSPIDNCKPGWAPVFFGGSALWLWALCESMLAGAWRWGKTYTPGMPPGPYKIGIFITRD